jgi:creatinine amidohydrolase
MIQHIAPDLVREDRLADARDDGVQDMRTIRDDNFVHGARTFYDARENSDNGVFGDQTDATAEKGAELFEAATEQLVHLLEWLDAREFAELLPEEHVDPQPGSRR